MSRHKTAFFLTIRISGYYCVLGRFAFVIFLSDFMRILVNCLTLLAGWPKILKIKKILENLPAKKF